MRVIVFDVETTGLLPKNPADEHPYITQLSYAIYNTDINEFDNTFNVYIKVPENIIISEKITELTGVTRELLNKKGVDIVYALQTFYNAYITCDEVVAHNLSFDSKMIYTETKRNFNNLGTTEESLNILEMFESSFCAFYKIEKYCTMMNSIDICSIIKTNSRGSYKKYPTLCELYLRLFESNPDNLHNSMIDVIVCLRCYLMIRHKITISDDNFKQIIDECMS